MVAVAAVGRRGNLGAESVKLAGGSTAIVRVRLASSALARLKLRP
jgi:hypothetical protein